MIFFFHELIHPLVSWLQIENHTSIKGLYFLFLTITVKGFLLPLIE